MKKLPLILFFIAVSQLVQAQKVHHFQIRGGFGFAGYGTQYEQTSTFGGFSYTESNSDGAATIYFPLDLRYVINDRFNVGLDMKFGSYLYDPDSSDGKSNRYTVIGIAGEYNIVSKDVLKWYVGIGFNACTLILEDTKTENAASLTSTSTYSGPGFRMNTGLLIYLTKGFGLNFNLGYDYHNFKLKKLEQNGTEVNLSNFDATLKLNGMDGTIGLFVSF